MRRLALYFASACLVLSVFVNAASYFGISLFENFVFLHFGIFVLGIPAALSAKNREIRKSPWWPPGAGFRALTEGGPTWGRKTLIGAYVYAVTQFVALFVLSRGGHPPSGTASTSSIATAA
jgi:hypothetical protein